MTELLTEKKANHRANVIRISEALLLPHPDPETTSLELVIVDGYQVVVRKGQFKPGDLAIYIQPDSVVPQTEPFRFIWEGHVGLDGTVPEKRRRITVRKFRKEWSEGLLLPFNDFCPGPLCGRGRLVLVGEDVSDLIGITHYDPETATQGTSGNQATGPKRKFRYPRTIRGWFNFLKRLILNKGRLKEATVDIPVHVPIYDVDALKNYKGTFVPGEWVIVTEKIHGSNARYLYLDGTQYVGSKNQWKARSEGSVWWKAFDNNAWIGEWCQANEGSVLWGEVTPTQAGYDFDYDYGSKEAQFFAFDIYRPDGTWEVFEEIHTISSFKKIKSSVPLLYVGPYSDEKIASLLDGPSTVPGAQHIREGIVIKPTIERSARGLGRVQLKVISNTFLEKDNKKK